MSKHRTVDLATYRANQAEYQADRRNARQMREDAPPQNPQTGAAFRPVTVEVDSMTDGLIVGGHMVPAGASTIEVYPPDLPVIESMVEPATAEDWARVEEHLGRHQTEAADKDRGSQHHWAPHITGSFRVVMGREMRPLRSARIVVDENAPEEAPAKSSRKSGGKDAA